MQKRSVNLQDLIESTKKKNIKLKQFELITTIGSGSFGKVILVKKRSTNKPYAMKVLKKEFVKSQNQKAHVKSNS